MLYVHYNSIKLEKMQIGQKRWWIEPIIYIYCFLKPTRMGVRVLAPLRTEEMRRNSSMTVKGGKRVDR